MGRGAPHRGRGELTSMSGKTEAPSAVDIAHWDEVAERYASSIGGPNDRIYAMLREAIWKSLGPGLSGLDVLDVGCGHGWLTALLLEAGANVRGIDGSAALLAIARRL